jgi:hypothetical protein
MSQESFCAAKQRVAERSRRIEFRFGSFEKNNKHVPFGKVAGKKCHLKNSRQNQ